MMQLHLTIRLQVQSLFLRLCLSKQSPAFNLIINLEFLFAVLDVVTLKIDRTAISTGTSQGDYPPSRFKVMFLTNEITT